MILKPALVYFAVVFAAAFAFGALRVTLIAPRIGALAAVALDVSSQEVVHPKRG